jgi:hypothetical protein
MYTGNLIDSLLSTAEKANQKAAEKIQPPTDPDDDIMLERESRVTPLTIDEVLRKSGHLAGLATANPYEALVRSVGRWL